MGVKKSVLFIIWSIAFFMQPLTTRAQTGPVGRFLLFNGSDQHLAIPNHHAFNISAGESYTICLRINPADFNDRYTILSKGNKLIPNGRYELATHKTTSDPNISLTVINSENANIGAPFFQTIQAGDWIHVAWVYNAADKSSKVYVNGTLTNTVVNQAIGRTEISNGYELTVGCGWTDASEPELNNFWPGQVDELRIWNRALTNDEVYSDQISDKPYSSGLIAAYDFENILNDHVPDISGEGHIGTLVGYGLKSVRTELPVGIGTQNERLVGFRMVADAFADNITSVSVDLAGTTTYSDIKMLKAWFNGSSERFDPKTARLFASAVPSGNKTVLYGNIKPAPGDNYFWITADISDRAGEGHKICASVSNYMTSGRTTVSLPRIEGSRTILLGSKLLFSSGDGGSEHYRIPAIVTAKDGTLITATDKRWTSYHDLPNHIDVVIRRSTDQGITWSDALTIAGTGINTGFGDPALVYNRKNSEVICLMAANKGFFYSTPENPIRIYQSRSADNGITWTVPVDITSQIYGAGCSNPLTQTWQGAFVTSGSAAQMHNGRLLAALSVREATGRSISNYVMYSDDNAKTWKVSPYRAATNGSEAKMVELENGKVLMSIRNSGTRMFNLSKDRGISWGIPYAQTSITDPSCNGDMIRYTSLVAGYKKNRMLHSIPFSNTRKNISVLMSYDEGQTWPVRKTIYPGISAYSSLSILNDGTIGMYYEVGEYEIYQMYFARFSLEWLTDGADTWSGRSRGEISSTEQLMAETPDFTVYPNPAIGEVNISGTLEYGTPVEIYDSKGQLMRRTLVENPGMPVKIELDGFSAGTYFVKVGTAVRQLMVVK